MKDKLIAWIEHIYHAEGFWPTVFVAVLFIFFWAAGYLLDVPVSQWLTTE